MDGVELKAKIKKLSKWSIIAFVFGVFFIASSIGIHFFAQYKVKQEVIQVKSIHKRNFKNQLKLLNHCWQ